MSDDIEAILLASQTHRVRGRKARALYAYLDTIMGEWHDLAEDPSPEARSRQAALWAKVKDVKFFPACADMEEFAVGQLHAEIEFLGGAFYHPQCGDDDHPELDGWTPSPPSTEPKPSPDDLDEIPF